jgi:OOP family OmpA-OmpF porin
MQIRAALVTAGLTAVAAVVSVPAVAQSMRVAPVAAQPAWYVGGGIGFAKLDGRLADTSLAVPGATASSFSAQTSDTAAKLYAGWNATPWLGVELAYLNFGEFDGRRDVTAPATRTVDVRWKLQGFAIGLKPTWRIGESFGVFGKVGTARMRTRLDVTDTGSTPTSTSETGNRWSLFYGLGAEYDFTRTFGIRAEWEMFKHATNTNVLSIGNGAIDYKTFFASAQFRF